VTWALERQPVFAPNSRAKPADLTFTAAKCHDFYPAPRAVIGATPSPRATHADLPTVRHVQTPDAPGRSGDCLVA
jgi:hypothetical protein